MRGKLTYANVVATIALVVALGMGTAWAADKLAKNSVGTKQLKDDAVVSEKVENGSLLGADFAVGQLPQGPQGLQGPQGEQGLQGERGLQGPPGPTKAAVGTAYFSNGTPVTSDPSGLLSLSEATIDVPQTGKLVIQGSIDSLNCSAPGGCAGSVGLYLDGTPLADTKMNFTSAAHAYSHVSLASVAPGSHTVKLQLAGGTATTINTFGGQVSAIFVGG